MSAAGEAQARRARRRAIARARHATLRMPEVPKEGAMSGEQGPRACGAAMRANVIAPNGRRLGAVHPPLTKEAIA